MNIIRKFYLMLKTAETMVYAGNWETLMTAMDVKQTTEAAQGCLELKERLKKGEIDKATYDEKTKQLKMGVPVLLPHFQRKDGAGNGALMDDAEWSNIFLYDIDDEGVKADGKAYYERWIRGHEAEWGILFAQLSLRGGLHLLGIRPDGMNVEEAQAWLHEQIGDTATKYDMSCKDLRRRMILAPSDYILYMEEERLKFADTTAEADAQKKAPFVKSTNEHKADGAANKSDDAEVDADKLWAEAQQVAGLTLKEAEEGERHETLKTILAKSGIAQVFGQDELAELVAADCPAWWQHDKTDIKNLIRDFSMKYVDTPVRVGDSGKKASGVGASASKAATAQEFKPRRTDYDNPMIFRPSCKTQLPEGLRQCVDSLTDSKLWIPEILAAVVTCGANLPQITSRDPMGYVHPSLLSLIIWAESGAGKSEVLRPVNILATPMREDDALARKKRKAFKELKKSRKASDALPAPPTDPICELPLDSTPAARAERAELVEASRRILFTVSDEGGCILSSSEKFDSYQLWYNAGWAEEVLQIARSSDESIEAYVHARLSCVMAAQPVYKSLIANTILQGMASRIMNVVLKKEVGPLVPLKPISKADEQAIIDLARRLRALPEKELDLPKLRLALKRWEEETVKKAIEAGDIVMQDDGIRGRIMTSCYRIGVVLTCCWMVDPSAKKKGGDSTLVIDQCLMLADYLADTFTLLFREDVERLKSGDWHLALSGKGSSEPKTPAKTANEQILDSLPNEFTKKDLAEKKPGAKDSTLRGLLKSWIDGGKLQKTGKVYKKVS